MTKVTVNLITLMWVDTGWTAHESLCSDSAAYIVDSPEETKVNKALDYMESNDEEYACFSTYEYSVEVDEKQAKELIEKYNQFNPEIYLPVKAVVLKDDNIAIKTKDISNVENFMNLLKNCRYEVSINDIKDEDKCDYSWYKENEFFEEMFLSPLIDGAETKEQAKEESEEMLETIKKHYKEKYNYAKKIIKKLINEIWEGE